MAELNDIVADVAEEVAGQATVIAEASRGLSQREMGIMFTGVLAGLISGSVTAYVLTKRRLETKYELLAQDEIQTVRDFYTAKKKAGSEKPALEDLVDALEYRPDSTKMTKIQATTAYDLEKRDREAAHQAQLKVEESADEIIRRTREEVAINKANVFADSTPDDVWDYQIETAGRDEFTPYVIHKDEFEGAELDFTTTTLTYYEEDDVLCDERDEVIGDQDMHVGLANLGKFGHGSKDSNVVYVRNHKYSLDMEIVRSAGSYAEEVHGFVEHAEQPRRRGPRRHVRE